VESRKLWVVITREYLERVRTRWFVLATVFGPIVFGTLLYVPAYVATRSRASVDVARIRILDATNYKPDFSGYAKVGLSPSVSEHPEIVKTFRKWVRDPKNATT